MCDSRKCTTPELLSDWRYTTYTFVTKKYPDPITIYVCTTCAGRMLTELAPTFNAKKATLTCLIMNKLSLHCENCLAFFRIERISPHTNTYVPQNHFCPHCGHKSVASLDPERDYWEIISTSLNLPVDLTHTLYDAWLYDPTHSKFVDFVAAMEADVSS